MFFQTGGQSKTEGSMMVAMFWILRFANEPSHAISQGIAGVPGKRQHEGFETLYKMKDSDYQSESRKAMVNLRDGHSTFHSCDVTNKYRTGNGSFCLDFIGSLDPF
jgi:hypothetical protein